MPKVTVTGIDHAWDLEFVDFPYPLHDLKWLFYLFRKSIMYRKCHEITVDSINSEECQSSFYCSFNTVYLDLAFASGA